MSAEDNNSHDIASSLIDRAEFLISSIAPIDIHVYPFFDEIVTVDDAIHNNAGFTVKFRLSGEHLVHPFKGLVPMQRLKVVAKDSLRGVFYDDDAMMLRWVDSSNAGQEVRLRLSLDRDNVFSFIDMKNEKVNISVWIMNDDETLSEKPKKRWSEYTPGQQSGIKCDDPAFRNYLFSMLEGDEIKEIASKMTSGEQKDFCASIIRKFCGVKSRSDINPNTEEGREPFRRWQRLLSGFREYSRRFD